MSAGFRTHPWCSGQLTLQPSLQATLANPQQRLANSSTHRTRGTWRLGASRVQGQHCRQAPWGSTTKFWCFATAETLAGAKLRHRPKLHSSRTQSNKERTSARICVLRVNSQFLRDPRSRSNLRVHHSVPALCCCSSAQGQHRGLGPCQAQKPK